MKVNFYFDYVSPYAYIAWKKLPALKQRLNLDIELKPILFAGVLDHWGQKGPAEIEPKARYVYTQCFRYSTKNNISFTRPLYHPFNPITCLRLSLSEVAGDRQNDVIDAIWTAGWQHGKDLSNKEVLIEVLKGIAVPAAELLAKTEEPQVKEKLKLNTTEAIQRGIFGVPTFITSDKTLFWGLDSMPDLEDYLTGKENLDQNKLEEILSRTSNVSRR